MTTDEEIFGEYKRMAPLMESMRRARRPQIRYHLLADAIYWSDEMPGSLESLSESCLRFILRYRTTLILGTPDEKWKPCWQEAKQSFPNWIGFLPGRTSRSTKLGQVYEKLESECRSEAYKGRRERERTKREAKGELP